MHLDSLKFRDGKVSGRGEDNVGTFDIKGQIEKNGHLWFVKQYHGKHAVRYEGVRNYHEIHGRWKIEAYHMEDSFHLTKVYSDKHDSDSD